MTLPQVIETSIRHMKPFRRRNWSHADYIEVVGFGQDNYGNGELHWTSGERARLFYITDLTADDWHIKGEEP